MNVEPTKSFLVIYERADGNQTKRAYPTLIALSGEGSEKWRKSQLLESFER